MANFNKVILVGHLTRDPELKQIGDAGASLCQFSIAVNHVYKNKAGEKIESVSFVDIKAWARLADIMTEYLHKGDPVLIEGRINQERWENKEGEKRSKLVIIAESFQFLKSRNDSNSSGNSDNNDNDGYVDEPPF